MATLDTLSVQTVVATSDKLVIRRGGVDYSITQENLIKPVVDDLATEIAATNAEITALQADRLKLDGSNVMTGLLTLSGAPGENLHAATKLYVDTADALKAPLASPTFTGTPASVTAAAATNTTQIATTAFVFTELTDNHFTRTIVAAATKTLSEAEKGIIDVTYTSTGVCTITLPTISSLTTAARVRYHIKDTGFAAGTNNITINRGGTDTIENGATSHIISTDGEAVEFYNDGTSKWYIRNVETAASNTDAGIIEIATDTEAKAFTDTTRAIVSSSLSAVLDANLFQRTEAGAATKVLVEADKGKIGSTYTSSGTQVITLPQISGLTFPDKTMYWILDEGGNAGTNNITVNRAGSDTINGGTSYIIDGNYDWAIFYNNGGTAWYVLEPDSSSVWTTSGSNIRYSAGNASIGTAAPTTPNSTLELAVTSGDPAITFDINTTNHFIAGVDDSDSDKFKISEGSALGTTDRITIDKTTGLVTIGTDLKVSSDLTVDATTLFNGNITVADGINFVFNSTTGTKFGVNTTGKIGFFNKTPVAQPTALTAAETTITNAGTASDYAIQAMTSTSPFGFVTQAEGETLVEVVLNNQLRINELETKLQSLGIIA